MIEIFTSISQYYVFDFLEERDYSLSYKMPFMLAVVKYIDSIGDAKIDDK